MIWMGVPASARFLPKVCLSTWALSSGSLAAWATLASAAWAPRIFRRPLAPWKTSLVLRVGHMVLSCVNALRASEFSGICRCLRPLPLRTVRLPLRSLMTRSSHSRAMSSSIRRPVWRSTWIMRVSRMAPRRRLRG